MHHEKNWVILTFNVESLAELKFNPTFYVKMTQFFLSALREKMSHFDLQSWVTGGTKIWPNFLGQNYLIFSSQCNEKKIWVILT